MVVLFTGVVLTANIGASIIAKLREGQDVNNRCTLFHPGIRAYKRLDALWAMWRYYKLHPEKRYAIHYSILHYPSNTDKWSEAHFTMSELWNAISGGVRRYEGV